MVELNLHCALAVPSLKQNRGAYWNEIAYSIGPFIIIGVLISKNLFRGGSS